MSILRHRPRPTAVPTLLMLLAWVVGSAALAGRALSVDAGVGLRAAQVVLWAAQSAGLYYLIGFVLKSVVYLVTPAPPTGTGVGSATRRTVVLYLTAGDFDEFAVDSLLRLDHAPGDLFLVHDDGRSRDARRRMRRFLRMHPCAASWRIALWRRPEQGGGKAGAVNWVLSRLPSAWDCVLLCDADSIARTADALPRAASEFDDPDVAVVQFRNASFSGPDEPPFQRRVARAIDVFDVFATAQARFGYLPFLGHNALLRLSAVREVGGLTRSFFSDDLDLSVRLTLAGRRIVYRRDVVFAERHPGDLRSFRKRSRKWAHGCVQVLRTRLFDVLRARHVPLAHRVGMCEFMGFYPAQALLLVAFVLAHLALPWTSPPGLLAPFDVALASLVVGALLAPTLAWAVKTRRLASWPVFAWTCALVYGGSILATARGVLDGFLGRRRSWVPTNLAESRPAVPAAGWAEGAFGVLLVLVPWLNGHLAMSLPASYVFVATFLFSPLTHAAYRARPPRRGGLRLALGRTAAVGALGGLVAAVPCARASAGDVTVDGTVLSVEGRPYQVRGIHYSPYPPGVGPMDPYPPRALVESDLSTIRDLGANTIHVHEAPGWVVETAHERGLRTLHVFGIDWNDPRPEAFAAQADEIVARVEELRGVDGVLAWILGHEVPPWLLEEVGVDVLAERLRGLAERVRAVDAKTPLGHASWPQSLALELPFLDLACFNLYPAWPYEVSVRGFGPYLREVLAPRAAGRPLLITEFGLNSLEASEERQAQVLEDCWREIERGPAVGGVVFGWADEWWKNYDNPIDETDYWKREYAPDDAARHDPDPEEHYGIVRSDRSPKPALAAVRRMWAGAGEGRSGVPWAVLAVMGIVTGIVFGVGRGRRPNLQEETE